MAKVKNITGVDIIHGGRLVVAGAVIETDPQYELYGGYTAGGMWEPGDDEARAEHAAALAALRPVEEPSLDWTKDALLDHAKAGGVDLGDAKTKAEILAAITEHTPEG